MSVCRDLQEFDWRKFHRNQIEKQREEEEEEWNASLTQRSFQSGHI